MLLQFSKNIGFVKWFQKKSAENVTALVFSDGQGLGAFICLKNEDEPINLSTNTLPAIPRKKISTLRIAERYRGQRLGEGAIGLILWDWQKSKRNEIYVTVFEKHTQLIGQLQMFGFCFVGHNQTGESVYLKSRSHIDYRDPYKSFPFMDPHMQKAGYLLVDDVYHDTLFPYSELSNTVQQQLALSVSNGVSKVYVGAVRTKPHYKVGEPIMIYRRHTKKDGQKPRYKSCITSYCVVTDIITVKTNGTFYITFDDLCKRIGNKSVFDVEQLREKYTNNYNVVVIEMLYYGYFGVGHNVNNAFLSDSGYWGNIYPTLIEIMPDQFKSLLKEGDVDVSNVIID